MAKKRLVTQFGMGTSIRSRDYTEAAARGIRDALWHNSLNVAEAFGFPKESMIIDVQITVVKGGLDVPRRDKEGFSVIANVAIVVSFDMESSHG